MIRDTSVWLPPILVTAGIAFIGWLLRSAVSNITNRIEDLEASFTRITADIVAEHRAMEVRIYNLDRRLVRVESWKEMVSLPGPHGEKRRIIDRMQSDEDTE